MEDIIKIVKFIEDWGIFLQDVNETITNKTKVQKGGILAMLLCDDDASLLLGNKFVKV